MTSPAHTLFCYDCCEVQIAFALFFVAVGVVLSFGVVVTWLRTYPDNVDPKNIYYVLWQHGLNNNMSLDSALGAMVGDASRVRQVQGLTKDQLKARFGYTRTLGEVTPYYQACYFTPGVFTRGNADRASKSKHMTVAKRTFLAILIGLSLCVIWLATPPLITPRIPFNHRRAIERINGLNLAEHNYAVRYPGSGYACSLGDLGKQGLVDKLLGAGTLSGYHFEIRCPQTTDQRSTGYEITALPVEPGHTGTYALCTDQSGEIWYSEIGSASDCLAMHKSIYQKYRAVQ